MFFELEIYIKDTNGQKRQWNKSHDYNIRNMVAENLKIKISMQYIEKYSHKQGFGSGE